MPASAIRLDDVSFRMFGPAYERKCADPKTIFCARAECQRANHCALSTGAGVKPAVAQKAPEAVT